VISAASRRSRVVRLTVPLAIILLVALVLPLTSAFAADATNGQTLFQPNCASCHAANAAGGIKVGGVTAPDIRWSAIGSTFNNDPALVSRAILNGKDEENKDLNVAMPRFAGQLSQSQADDIVAYLKTLAGSLPKTGDPIGSRELALAALAAGVLAVGGLTLRRVAQ
jgi:LPXTG-motif cell wall-anchored protein